jgi:hypothetical protein
MALLQLFSDGLSLIPMLQAAVGRRTSSSLAPTPMKAS